MPRDYAREYGELAQAYKSAAASAKSQRGREMARMDYEEALRDIAMEQQREAQARPVEAPAPKRPSVSLGEDIKGAARALAQGATFGFGEELESLPYALPGGESPAEARQRIRGEMRQYREQRPGVAMGAELLGSVAPSLLSGGAATGAAVGRSAVKSALGAASRSAALSGALSGAGAAEGGIGARTAGAVTGGVLGGVGGKVLGSTAAALGRGAERIARTPSSVLRFGSASPVIRALATAAEEAGVQDVRAAAGAAGAGLGPEARVMDILGVPGQRLAESIRAAGGRAARAVEEPMVRRLDESQGRLVQNIYGKRLQENVLSSIDESIARGRELSEPFYKKFEQEVAQEIPQIDALLKTPLGQEAIARARRVAANAQREFIEPAVSERAGAIVDQFGRAVVQPARPAKYTPQALDDIKKAMDQLIYESPRYRNVQAGQGGALPGELGDLKKLRRTFVDAVDQAYPETYAAARSAWGGEYAVREALESGQDLAMSGRMITPEEIAKNISEYAGADLEAFRRGYLDGIRQRIEAGNISPKSIDTQAFSKRINAVFGPEDGARIVDAFRREKSTVAAARRIIGRAPGADDADEVVQSSTLALPSLIRTVAGVDRTRQAARLAGAVEGRLRGSLFEGRRMQMGRELMRPASSAGKLLEAVAREQAITGRGAMAERVLSPSLARALGIATSRAISETF